MEQKTNYTNYQILNNKRLIDILKLIHANPNITNGEIATALNRLPSAISASMKKYLDLEPPLISKTTNGKYTLYNITDIGMNFLLQSQNKYCTDESEVDLITYETKKELISYILNSQNDKNNTFLNMLKEIEIDRIAMTFSFEEFINLCHSLDILNPLEENKKETNINKIITKQDQTINSWQKLKTLINHSKQ